MIINHDCCYHHNRHWSSWRSWSGEDGHCRRYHHDHHRWWMHHQHHHHHQQQQQQHRQDVGGWWRGFFIMFLNYMNWIREKYSNDSAFIMLVIVTYCGKQIYFTYNHATTIVVKQSRWPWIIGIWYHIGKSRQSIKTFTYIMDVLHMFAMAKTGDSHMTDCKASNAWS